LLFSSYSPLFIFKQEGLIYFTISQLNGKIEIL